MSVHLTALVWKVRFPSQTQKLTMMRLADFAHEDGTDIYPAIDTVAEDIGASRRQTQYAIKSLESCGLLTRVHAGGKEGRKSNQWKMDNDLLVALALQELKLVGSHDRLEAVENEGAIIAPRDLLRVQSSASRVLSETLRGAPDSTQTVKNHYIEPSTRASAGENGKSHGGKARPRLLVEKGDPSWQAWLDFAEGDLLKKIFEDGKVEASSRWPGSDVVVFTKAKSQSKSITNRITGEREDE